jgi:hypothetical protein
MEEAEDQPPRPPTALRETKSLRRLAPMVEETPSELGTMGSNTETPRP